ncbi:hypothetical protein [Sodalis sp. dw_96]|uniref:hypothetical protein n=1 Tax=Sodalis sp. dw_96 TaxID=2719794 RepID=UPI001BD3EAB2|nr:hypothetical protein [Sodalis sp. dw_96]
MRKIRIRIFFLLFCMIPWTSFASDWVYSQKKDEMRNAVSYSAYLPSLNSVEFNYPYNGGSSLSIVFISNDNKIVDKAGISLTKGQMFCADDEKCYAHAKFDDGRIINLNMIISKSNPDTALIVGPKGFADDVFLSKGVIIEVPVFKDGEIQFKFNLDGFKWRGAPENLPFVTSLGSFPFGKRTDELDLKLKNGQQTINGESCFVLPDINLFKTINLKTNVKYCGFNGYLVSVGATYPYNQNNYRKLVAEIGKYRGMSGKINNSFYMWGLDEYGELTTIFMYLSKKDGISFIASYSPVSIKVSNAPKQ